MKKLAFYPPHEDYSWPYDDIIVFAFSCRAAGLSAVFFSFFSRLLASQNTMIYKEPFKKKYNLVLNFVHAADLCEVGEQTQLLQLYFNLLRES